MTLHRLICSSMLKLGYFIKKKASAPMKESPAPYTRKNANLLNFGFEFRLQVYRCVDRSDLLHGDVQHLIAIDEHGPILAHGQYDRSTPFVQY